MPEQVLPGIFRLEIPMPKNPLKAINSYVIQGADRNLIVDTGLDRDECISVMNKCLSDLSLDLNKTDFFATHMHADHCALIPSLKSPGSAVYASSIDAVGIRSLTTGLFHWQPMVEYACRSGMPQVEAESAIQRHPGYKFGPKAYPEITIVKEGSKISVGDYNFVCLETPGHTVGHICLYEPDKKILLSGDHVLGDITPNISLLSEQGNPLDDYLKSLDKVAALKVDIVLPGHRRVFTDCRKRIEELQEHHQHRNEEILSILAAGNRHAFDVAARMTWDMSYSSFNEFPPTQKWFATGETIAHLKYLESQNRISRLEENNTIYWGLN